MTYVSHCRNCGFVFRVAALRPAFTQRCPLCLSACDPIAIEPTARRPAGPPRADRPHRGPARLPSVGS